MKYGDIELTGSLSAAVSGGSIELLSSIVPDTSGTLSLGTSGAPFKDLYLTNDSLYLGVDKITTDDNGILKVNGVNVAEEKAGLTWVSRSAASDENWSAVTYGNGLFVAVGGSGSRVMTSTDCVNWESQSGDEAVNTWVDVTYGAGLFVAVANTNSESGNRVMSSPNGIDWTLRASAADLSWTGIAYGNGLFVAIADDGTGDGVMTSPDAITWTSRVTPVDNTWHAIEYGAGIFSALSADGSGNRAMSSTNGIDWTIRVSAADENWRDMTYGNGLFVAIASSGGVMTSPDAINWLERTPSESGQNWRGITYGNGLYVATSITGTNTRIMTSPDAITWTTRENPDNKAWKKITYGNGMFVSVASPSDLVMTSGVTDEPKVFDAAPVLNKEYFSSGQTITSAGSLVLPHGLGVEPKSITLILECTTAEDNYSIGDRVIVGSNNSTEITHIYNTVVIDDTNVSIRFAPNAGSCFIIGNKTTGAKAVLVNANWKLYVRAFS